MKRFLLILLCLLMVVGMTACGNKPSSNTPPVDNPEEQDTPCYAADKVINRLFVEFTKKYPGLYLDTRSIRRAPGTDSTKPEDLTKEYLAVINGHNVTIRNATYETENDKGKPLTMYQLRVIIEGGTTVKSRDTMLNTFALIATATDPTCTATTADKAVDAMKKMTKSGQYRVSDYIRVEQYTPIVEEYKIPTKIEMVIMNYAPLDEDEKE